jgi:uncharacterized protein YjbJ (UPF0337 family)
LIKLICVVGRPLKRNKFGRDGVLSALLAQPSGPIGAASERSNLMNWDRVEGNWKQFRGQVQQQWGKLTNDDLDTVEGRRTELVGKIQERYGIAKDEAEKQVDTWMRNI